MAFAHFRRHQKLYLVLGLGAMIFSLVTFSVGSTISAFARTREVTDRGSFVDSLGETIPITQDAWQKARLAGYDFLQGFYRAGQEDAVVEHIVMGHEAEIAGIQVSDEMLSQWLEGAIFRQFTVEDYRTFIAQLGISTSRFEKHVRQAVAIVMLRALRDEGDLITSREIYDRFASDNEIFAVAYAPFPFAKYAGEIDRAQVTDDELRAYYEKEMNQREKESDFSTPEGFRFEVAYLDFTTADVDAFGGLLDAADEPTQEAIERHFAGNKMRYRTSAPPPATPAPDGEASAGKEGSETVSPQGGEEGGKGGPRVAGASPQDEGEAQGLPEEPTPGSATQGAEGAEAPAAGELRDMTLEEARPLVRKDLLLEELLEKLQEEYRSKRTELEKAATDRAAAEKAAAEQAELEKAAAETAAPESESAGEGKTLPEGEKAPASGAAEEPQQPKGDSATTGEKPAASADAAGAVTDAAAALNRDLKEAFKALAEKYHLTYVSYADPLSRDEIVKLDPIGDENLKIVVPSVAVNDVRVRLPIEEQRFGYVLRMSERVAPQPRPFAELDRDKLLDSYVRGHQARRAAEEAQKFYDRVEALATVDVAAEVEKIKQEALTLAEQRIATSGITDEEAKEKVRRDVLDGEKTHIRELVRPRMASHADAAAGELGLAVERLEPFRTNFEFSTRYRRLSGGPLKYLSGYQAGVTRLEVGEFSDVLTDAKGEACYVAWVASRRKPDPEEMTPNDRSRALSSVMRTHMIGRGMMPNRKDPQAFKRLEIEYQLKLRQRDEQGSG
ncbi:MAG: hypothetical protein AB1486_13080 [Planctomycetota bacterium]